MEVHDHNSPNLLLTYDIIYFMVLHATHIRLELLTSKHSFPILVHRKVAADVLAEFSCNTKINVKNLITSSV
jgi:hypothetical protein